MISDPSSVQSLKKLKRAFPDFTQLQEIILELTSGDNDRALAITTSAMLERALEELISSCFVELTIPERKSLFEGDSPLATFSAKIKIGYAMGLYNSFIRDDLDTLREIRNAFAHTPIAIHFKTLEISQVCARLKVQDALKFSFLVWGNSAAPEKAKFSVVSMALLGLFLQASQDEGLKNRLMEFGVSWFLLEPSQ